MSKKSDKKRVDQDVRPEGPWFENYDYGGPEEASETSPGRGLYNGKMDKYKSVKEFIDKKRKKRKELKAFTLSDLVAVASEFEKLAQQSVDTSFTDAIRKTFGPLVFKDAEKMIQERGVSSIVVKVNYNGNQATLEINAVGSEGDAVSAELSKLLNQKYSQALTKAISKALGGSKQSFSFGLTTVETPG